MPVSFSHNHPEYQQKDSPARCCTSSLNPRPKYKHIKFKSTYNSLTLKLFAVPIKGLVTSLLASFGRSIAFITTEPYPEILTL